MRGHPSHVTDQTYQSH